MRDSPTGSTGPPAPHETPPWLAEFAEHAREERVVGVAELPTRGGWRHLVVVTTWHGFDAVVGDLPRLGALILGGPPVVEQRGSTWTGISSDLRRVVLDVRRVGDLLPDDEGAVATVLLDRNGLLDQWVRWSRGRDRTEDPSYAAEWEASETIDLDGELRLLAGLEPGCRTEEGGAEVPLRPILVRAVREKLGTRSAGAPLAAALAARADELLRSAPQDGAGIRVVPRRASAADPYDAFLRVADGEGFRGDRVLFDAAAARLAALSRRAPRFDEGFVVPTFDAVEVRWSFGAGAPLAGTSLVPCVHVGVGVTPADHLDMWAAPAVREACCTVACVADDGNRRVLPRDAGREALLAALVEAVEVAWKRLPGLLRAARRSSRLREDDPAAALAALHLPRTFRESAAALLRREGPVTRLAVALALSRAGDDAEPLVARKLGWGAGRLLASAPDR